TKKRAAAVRELPVPVALLALVLAAAAVVSAARAADAPTMLAPDRARITDRVIAQDGAALDGLGRRIAAFDTVTIPRRVYTHALAVALGAQGLALRRKAADCIIPVAIAPAPEPAPSLPEAAPSQIPAHVAIALKRLGAMNNVHFELNGNQISAASAQVLDSVAVVMRDVSEVTAVLVGHTDPRGSVAYNLALGRRRALAVRDYLERAGVDTSRFAIASEGKGSPVAIGAGTLEHAMNRRVELQ